jgi:hypothetical protein
MRIYSTSQFVSRPKNQLAYPGLDIITGALPFLLLVEAAGVGRAITGVGGRSVIFCRLGRRDDAAGGSGGERDGRSCFLRFLFEDRAVEEGSACTGGLAAMSSGGIVPGPA